MITILPLESRMGAYLKYECQNEPQSVSILLDSNGFLYARPCGNIGGGMSIDEFNGLTTSWHINSFSDGNSINEFFDKNRELFQQVNDGKSVVHDGSKHVGQLNESATEAYDKIQYKIDDNEIECFMIFGPDEISENVYLDDDCKKVLYDGKQIEKDDVSATLEEIEDNLDHPWIMDHKECGNYIASLFEQLD